MNIDAPNRSHIPALRDLWSAAFHDTEEFLDNFGMTAFSTDRCRCVTFGKEVIAALYWFNCLHEEKKLAYIYAVMTAREYRGQGICHKLIADTHLHLRKQGYEGAILVPGSGELFRLYESMGYEICSHILEFSCLGVPDKIDLYSIGKEEYGALRRKFLPENGVVQENENLDFLETQVKFYSGSTFLLAACRKADTLYGVELLGDTTVAPRLVHALGYKQGHFRAPGVGRPFAMYYPLGDSKHLPPSYFGLAFD